MNFRTLLLAALALAVWPAPDVRAADDNAADVAKIRACIKKMEAARQDREGCIFMIANPCHGADETTVPADRIVTGCHRRETEAWDRILNDAYRVVRDGVDDEQRIKLRDMQRAWIDARTKSCNFLYDFFQGSMAYPMIAYCENREAARRALFLLRFATDVAERKN